MCVQCSNIAFPGFVFRDVLTELTADATDADLAHSLSWDASGLQVHVAGFSQQLPRLLLLILEHVMYTATDVNVERFEQVKDKRIRALTNVEKLQPYLLTGIDAMEVLGTKEMPSAATNLRIVKQVRAPDLRFFADRLLGVSVLISADQQGPRERGDYFRAGHMSAHLHPLPQIEVVVFGNETRERAVQIAKVVECMVRYPGVERSSLAQAFDGAADKEAAGGASGLHADPEEFAKAAKLYGNLLKTPILDSNDKRVRQFYNQVSYSQCVSLATDKAYEFDHVSQNPVETNSAIRLYFQVVPHRFCLVGDDSFMFVLLPGGCGHGQEPSAVPALFQSRQ